MDPLANNCLVGMKIIYPLNALYQFLGQFRWSFMCI